MSKYIKAYKEHKLMDQVFPFVFSDSLGPFSFPPHYHEPIEIIYVLNGILNIEVNHSQYKLKEGDLLIVGSQHIHSYHSDTAAEDLHYYMAILDWHHLEGILKDKDANDYLYPVLLKTNHFDAALNHKFSENIQEIFDDINREQKLKDKGYKLIVTSHLYRFLTLCARQLSNRSSSISEPKSLKKENEFIHTVNDFIYNNYTRPITLEEAAEVSGYSLYHFTRLFKKYTGYTFLHYLTNFRINMIKEALYTSDEPITQLAYAHGFNSIKTFNRAFKEMTTVSPTNFKKAINDQ